ANAATRGRVLGTVPRWGQSLLASDHPFVADAAGEAIRVEALEQKLRRAPRDTQRVAETRQGDRLERVQCLAPALVELGRDREAVADPLQPPGRFEESGELSVLDPGHAFGGELRLEAFGGLGLVAEGGGGTRRIGLAATPLDVQQRQDRRRPGLMGEQLAERNAGVERIHPGSLVQTLPNYRPDAFQPGGPVSPVTCQIHRSQAVCE